MWENIDSAPRIHFWSLSQIIIKTRHIVEGSNLFSYIHISSKRCATPNIIHQDTPLYYRQYIRHIITCTILFIKKIHKRDMTITRNAVNLRPTSAINLCRYISVDFRFIRIFSTSLGATDSHINSTIFLVLIRRFQANRSRYVSWIYLEMSEMFPFGIIPKN